eukprot:CAMPEP_0117661934 /NCGR_PEP_ID=MMETSP0804-20121206/7797_1 /TAXON_ID=1074897 /ORGANISM="Tetraselmis astigmatica, Strain CCMP880" /LENGTH=498 /DNA_ID=CAMNT_0005468825 /DNA_START=110 /DNA_END=1606 /DNA_ORIENTATION=-
MSSPNSRSSFSREHGARPVFRGTPAYGTPGVASSPLPLGETYLRFNMNELGQQLGVRPDELVEALHRQMAAADDDARTEMSTVISDEDMAALLLDAEEEKVMQRTETGLLMLLGGDNESGQAGGAAEEEEGEDVQYSVIEAEQLPVENFVMSDLNQILQPSDSQPEIPVLTDLEAHYRPAPPSSVSFGGEDGPHGFLIKVADGTALLEGHISDKESECGTLSDLLEQHLSHRLIPESMAGSAMRDTYMLALPDTGEDDNVAFKSMVLPSDIDDVTITAQDEDMGGGEKVPTLQLTVHRKAPVLGYALLVLAVLGVASLGAGFRMMGGANAFLKSCWRGQASLVFLTPWAVASVSKNRHVVNSLRSWTNQGLLLIVAFGAALYGSLFVMSLNYTSMGTAFLLSNSHSLLITAWRLLTGGHVSTMEAAGVFLGLAGAAVTTLDNSETGDGANRLLSSWLGAPAFAPPLLIHIPSKIFGALLALASGIAGACYITVAAKVR